VKVIHFAGKTLRQKGEDFFGSPATKVWDEEENPGVRFRIVFHRNSLGFSTEKLKHSRYPIPLCSIRSKETVHKWYSNFVIPKKLVKDFKSGCKTEPFGDESPLNT
jgi:hypothetical protein